MACVILLLAPMLPWPSVVAQDDGADPSSKPGPEAPPPVDPVPPPDDALPLPPMPQKPPAKGPERFISGVRTLPATAVGSTFHGARVLAVDEAARFLVVEADDPAGFRGAARDDDNVRYVEPDRFQPLLLEGPGALHVPDDVRYGSQYGPAQIGAETAWETTLGDTDAAVCIIDTGVRYTHEDLAGTRWMGGYDFVADDADPMDDHYHGTHVAAIAAATTGNALGVAGIGQVRMNGAKVLTSEGWGYWSWVAQGITWCADHGGPRSVLSMSLGGAGYSQAVQDAVDYAFVTKGHLVVAAAGNSGPCEADCILYPAAMQNVLAVTCTDPDEALCWFSSTGPRAALAAPGFDVVSALGTADAAYGWLSGTSMSTPHVSGAAALYWSAQTDLTNLQLRDRLLATAQDLGTPAWDDRFGCGEVDLAALFSTAPGIPCAPPPAPPQPPPPTNDQFADAFAVPATPYSNSQSTLMATEESDEPDCYGTLYASVWYRFTAGQTGTIVVNTTGSAFSPVLAAYTGPAIDDLTTMGCDWGFFHPEYPEYTDEAEVGFDVVAGRTYYLQVGGYYGDQGALVLNIGAIQPPMPAPGNDAFANARVAGTVPYDHWQSTRGATVQTGEPAPCGEIGATVWFRYTPERSGTLLARTVYPWYTTVVAAYAGSGLDGLAPLGCVEDASGTNSGAALRIPVVEGETIHIQVGGKRSTTGTTGVMLALAPDNDDFAAALPVPAAPATPMQSTLAASVQPGEPRPCGNVGATVWYRYVAPADDTLVADTAGSGFDTVVAAYTGSDLGNLVLVACGDNTATTTRGRVVFQVQAGTTYFLQAGGARGGEGDLVLDLSLADPPANDDFAAALPVPGFPYVANGPTFEAGTEAGEPSPCGGIAATTWYTFVADETGLVIVDTTGSDFDTVLAAHAGTSLATLTTLGCNDDVLGGASRLVVDVVAGTTYHIQVGGAAGAVGEVVVRFGRGPTNDLFERAAAVPATPYSAFQLTIGATSEPGEPAPCGLMGATVWYRYTAERTATLAINTAGSTFDTVVAAYAGPSLDALTTLGCNDPLGRIKVHVDEGVTYHIQVGGFAARTGDLTVAFALSDPPPHDMFATAKVLPEVPFEETLSTIEATREPGEPSGCGGIGATVWYRFTPERAETMLAKTGWWFGGAVAAYRGTDLGSLTFVACDSDYSGAAEIRFSVVAGETYYVQAGGYGGASGNLQLSLGPVPPNDNFADALDITGIPYVDRRWTAPATMQPNEPQPCDRMQRTVWYRLTPQTTQVLHIDTVGSDYGMRMALYTGQSFGTLVNVACGTGVPIHRELVGGVTYYLQVGDWYTTATHLVLNVLAPPANDNEPNAIVFGGPPYEATQTTRGASRDGPFNCPYPESDVWYRFTAPATQLLAVDTYGSDYDTALGVYRRDSLGQFVLVACNYDSAGTAQSRVVFSAVVGTTYLLRVADGGRNEQGNLVLHVTEAQPPANDAFAAATAIAELPVATTQDTWGATTQSGEPRPCSSYGATVWYRFTAPAAGLLSADTFGSDFDTVLAAYKGASLTGLTSLACNDDAPNSYRSQIAFEVVAGKTYHLQAGGFLSTAGSLHLQVSLVAYAPPDPPVALEATPAPAAGQISLSWQPPGDPGTFPVETYRVRRAMDCAGPFADVAEVAVTAPWYTDSGLGYGATRCYVVLAVSDGGESLPSAPASATTFQLPSAPTNLVATAGPAAGEISLSWQAPAENGGVALSGYRVERATSCDGAFAAIASPSAGPLSYTDSGLGNGATRCYRVAATTSVGTGPPSETASATTFTYAPQAPQGFQAAAGPGRGQISLSWQAPDDGGNPITGYRVERAADCAATFEFLATAEASAVSYADEGLGNGVTRCYRIAATNGLGAGPWSPANAATTPIVAPTAPTAFAVTAGPDPGQISLSWQPPGDDGGAAITEYRVERSSTCTASFTVIATVGSGTLSHVDSGLGNGATRCYRVAATNGIGTGAPTASLGATTFRVPGSPTSVSATTGASPGQIALSWQPPATDGGMAVTSYAIRANSCSGSMAVIATVPATTLAYVEAGIGNGVWRCYTVAATNGVGEGPASGLATAQTLRPPSAPLEFAAQAGAGQGQITLSWQAPSDPGDGSVTGFKVYRGTSTGNLVLLATLGDVRTFTDGGLPNGALRYYKVTAVNEIGEGAASPTRSARTFAVPSAPPGAAASGGAKRIDLAWDPPANLGGLPVTAYEIHRGTSSGSQSLHATVDGASTTFTDTGLGNGQTFHYKVRAINDVGAGAFSVVVSATTAVPPSAPQLLTAHPGPGLGEATLAWRTPSASGGAPITNYRIYRATGNDPLAFLAEVGDVRTFVDAVPATGAYRYEVSAVNGAGEGPSSNPAFAAAARP